MKKALTSALTAAVVVLLGLGSLAVAEQNYTPASKQHLLDANTQAVVASSVVTNLGGAIVLTSSGVPNAETNAVTVAAPKAVGDLVVLIVNPASTNLVSIADSGTVRLASAWVADGNDTLTLYAATATNWVEISRSAN